MHTACSPSARCRCNDMCGLSCVPCLQPALSGMAGCNVHQMFMPDRQHQADSGSSLDFLNGILWLLKREVDEGRMTEQRRNLIIGTIHQRLADLPRPYPGLRLPYSGILPSNCTTKMRRVLMQCLPYVFHGVVPGKLGDDITRVLVRKWHKSILTCMTLCGC